MSRTPPQKRHPAKNYITPGGLRALQDELQYLVSKERPEVTAVVAWAAGNGDRSENADYQYGKRRLRQIDGRLHFLAKRIESAEVIDPAESTHTRIFFGATVTVADEDGVEQTYSIVGVDESDAKRNRISWVSPLARALMKRQEGDVISFDTPGGSRELEITAVEYLALEP